MTTGQKTSEKKAETLEDTSETSANGYVVPKWRSKLNIHQRVLAAIEALAQAGPLARDAANTQQSYRFASHNAIKEALAPVLAHYGILHVMTPTARESGTRQQPGSTYQGTKSPDKEVFWVRIEWEMKLINTERPKDAIVVSKWPSYAEDYGDKAESKAATIGEKTFLVKQFKIATTDDDTDGGVDQTRARRTVRPVPPPPSTRPQSSAGVPHPSAPAPRPPSTPAPTPPVASPPPAARPVTSASAPPITPPSTPPSRNASAPETTAVASVVTAPVAPSVTPTPVATEPSPAPAPAATPLTEDQLLLLALPEKLTEAAIRVKLRNSGLQEAAKWVGKNHRANCPLCADYNRISLMIATHQPAVDPNPVEVDPDDLPPLAR